MGNVVLACRGVSRLYEQGKSRVQVLHAVDFEILTGQCVAVVGVSGAGKSTLLHLLCGLDQPDEGHVELNGQRLDRLSETQLGEARNRNLGFVYQFHHLLPDFTALENVAMPLRIADISLEEAESRSQVMLSRVGLVQRANHKPSELSGGERQRVAIARALVTGPVCVLADEPTGNLDTQTAHKVYDLFLELNQDLNTSLLMVTHDKLLAGRMERVIHLENGRLSGG